MNTPKSEHPRHVMFSMRRIIADAQNSLHGILVTFCVSFDVSIGLVLNLPKYALQVEIL